MMRSILYALVMTLFPLALWAEVPDMKFLRLDTRDGLSNSSILCLHRDSKGFMWIGTPYGLNRYDGYRFRTFYQDVKDTMSLRNNYVDEIYEDGEGLLWVRQGMNYTIFDPRTEKGDRHPERVLEKWGVQGGLEFLYIDREKNFWVKSYDQGYWHVDVKSKKAHQFRLGYGDQEFNIDFGVSGYAETDRLLFVTSNNGEVFCFDKQKNRILWKNNHLRQRGLVSNQSVKPRVDAWGNLWLISTGCVYVFKYDSNQWYYSLQEALRAWGYEGVPDEMNVWDIRLDKENRYWIATDHGGLYVVDPKDKVIRQFLNNKYDESTISDNTVRMIYRDQLDRMWLGTYTAGVNLYTGGLSNFINLEIGNINTICTDKQGLWWLGTNDKGIICYDPKTKEQVVYNRENSGIRSNTMVGSLCARDGSVWFGTYEGGLIRIKDRQVTNLLATGDTTGLNVNNIWTICEDQWGHLWLGELGGGVQRVDKRTGRMRSFRMNNSKLPSEYINTISRTKKGWLLVAHSNYMSLINPKTMEVINRNISQNKSGVPVTEASIFGYEDSRGLIWQGSTSGSTVWDTKTGDVYLLDMKSGLFGSTVNGMIEDDRHTVWLVTDHGVSNVIPQRQEDGTWHFVIRSYNNRDGLQDGPYNQRSVCYTADGLILVGGQGGLDVINPKNLGKGRIKESPIFSGLLVFDRDVAVGEKVRGRVILDEVLNDCRDITLRYDEQFTIQLGSSSGEIHNRSRFVYRLEGFNDDWVRTSELNPNITYNSLSSGSYTLHVRMLNDDGTFSDEESLLEISIRPPFWRSGWMMLFYLVLLAVGLWYWRKWYIKRNEQKMRAEELRRETEKLQWMSEMRAQMAAERAAAVKAAAEGTATADVVDDTVVTAKPELQLQLQDCDLVTVVKNVCTEFAITEEGVKAKVTCRPMVEELSAPIDRKQLARALNILLSNSVRFSPGNCQITVSLGRVDGDRAVLQVADNSVGIRDEFKATVFEPFLDGEGIGLDKVKDIVVAHGGTIRLEDNPGGGSIFIISLPVNPQEVIEEAVLMDDDE
mgnify:CR=1 FL=1